MARSRADNLGRDRAHLAGSAVGQQRHVRLGKHVVGERNRVASVVGGGRSPLPDRRQHPAEATWCSWTHPAGAVALVAVLVVAMSSSRSPAASPAGSPTVGALAAVFTEAAPTKETSATGERSR